MEVTPSGMETERRFWQRRNASLPIAVMAYPSSVSGMDSIDEEPVYLTIAAAKEELDRVLCDKLGCTEAYCGIARAEKS